MPLYLKSFLSYRENMRIGFDSKRAFYNRSGLGNYSRFIIQSLLKFHPNLEYYLYTPKSRNSIDFLPDNSSVKTIEPVKYLHKKLSSYWRSISLAKDLVRDQVDIYHGLSGEIPKNISSTNIRSVVTIHDLIFLRYPELYKSIDRNIYEKKIRFACANANKIIAISEQTKQDIVHYFGTSESKIEVIYQSCDERFQKEVTQTQKQAVGDKYDLPNEYLLYVGTIEKRKNLLSVVKALHHGKINCPLVVVGRKTDYFNEVSDYLHENLVENVIFLEGVPNEDLPAIYQMSKLFIYPSVFEGFGIPILEALYSKVPVITSKGSCFPEAGGSSSIYVSPDSFEEIAESITNVLNDNALRDKMIANGFKHAQKFSHEKLTQQLVNLYTELKDE